MRFTDIDVPWPSSIPKPGNIVPGGGYSVEMTNASTGQKFEVKVQLEPFRLAAYYPRVCAIQLLPKVPEKVSLQEAWQ